MSPCHKENVQTQKGLLLHTYCSALSGQLDYKSAIQVQSIYHLPFPYSHTLHHALPLAKGTASGVEVYGKGGIVVVLMTVVFFPLDICLVSFSHAFFVAS